MKKDQMIKLRISSDMLEWLRKQPDGMSATIRRLVANEMAIDDYIKNHIPLGAKDARKNNH